MFEEFAALTFDCYGTLIDWRGGSRASLAMLSSLSGAELDPLIENRTRLDFEMIQGQYRPYPEILEETLRSAADRQGLDPSDLEVKAFAKSMASWPPFVDSTRALKGLAEKFRLAILSNAEKETLKASAKLLGVEFEELICAEELKSYKPARAHFDEAAKRLDLPPERILHVAQSLDHDIRPAEKLGFKTVWVNREDEPQPGDVHPVMVVESLAEFAQRVGC